MCSDYKLSNQVIPNPYEISQQNLTFIFNLMKKILQIDRLENIIESKGILVSYTRVVLYIL